MKLIPVTSSNISAVGYDPSTREMQVQFKGGKVYTHAGVSPEDHGRFIASPSKGKHYHATFKGRFGARKV